MDNNIAFAVTSARFAARPAHKRVGAPSDAVNALLRPGGDGVCRHVAQRVL